MNEDRKKDWIDHVKQQWKDNGEEWGAEAVYNLCEEYEIDIDKLNKEIESIKKQNDTLRNVVKELATML